MLFFHGGSWESGSASAPVYGGDAAVALYEDTIIVTANYRLSIFGFLGSDKLRAKDGSTGNFGLQDQRAAMVSPRAFGG
jgi:para-nitrobenzyl esterase